MTDWKKLNEELEKMPKGNFWTRPEGRYKLRIIGEPLEVPDKFNEGGIRIQFPIKLGNEELIWEMGKSGSMKGPYGQIVKLGALMQKEGKELKGAEITVKIKGKGTEKSYDIDELFDYLDRTKQKAQDGPSFGSIIRDDIGAFL